MYAIRSYYAFASQEYWTLEALLSGAANKPFKASLQAIDGKKLGKFAISNQASYNFV